MMAIDKQERSATFSLCFLVFPGRYMTLARDPKAETSRQNLSQKSKCGASSISGRVSHVSMS